MKILLHPLLILTAYAIEARQFPVKKVERNSDRFIVRYKNDDGRSSAHRAATEVHAHLAPQKAVAGTFSSEALEGLHNNSNIEYVEQDYLRYLKRGYDTNDLFKQQMYNNETGDENYRKLTETVPYGIPMVQADQVPYDSSNPRTVCIIDSGYALGHEDLPSTNVDGYSLDANFPWNQDNFGHGTHIAGTIAAVSGNANGVVGVAPGVNLFIVRVGGENIQDGVPNSDLVAAAYRCKDAGANIISISIGGTSESKTEKDAYEDLYTIHNILIVAAAGNDGNTQEGTELNYPASYDSIMSVGAVDSNKVVAAFSQRNDQVEIAAPGVKVLSTVPIGTGLDTTLKVTGKSYISNRMTGSYTGIASGILVDCGIGDYDCTAARDKICLIQRGVLYFFEKVLACQNGGGLGAVIYNNVAGELLGNLVGTETQIPSIGISDTDGAYLLANKLGNSATVAVSVSNLSYANYDGTSMATPHVSAVAALIWSHDPTKTASEVRAALQSTAEDLGVPGRDNLYGYGLVQAAAACSTLIGGSCTPSDTEASSDSSTGSSLSPISPSGSPSGQPSSAPSSSAPSSGPSIEPSTGPSRSPSASPSVSAAPSSGPSSSPSTRPSSMPSSKPSSSSVPSSGPSSEPSAGPSRSPSAPPSVSAAPSSGPSSSPSTRPSSMPSSKPSSSSAPSSGPSSEPSTGPSRSPSASPSVSVVPSSGPSSSPSTRPSSMPSSKPSSSSTPSPGPSSEPSTEPSRSPSASPSVSAAPSSGPSSSPSTRPSSMPSNKPSSSSAPSSSSMPSSEPSSSSAPSNKPSSSSAPSSSSMPSSEPTSSSSAPSSNLGPRPFLASCSLDSDCLSNNCKDLVCRSSPTAKANKIKMSRNRGGAGGGAKGEQNRRQLWQRQTGPRGRQRGS